MVKFILNLFKRNGNREPVETYSSKDLDSLINRTFLNQDDLGSVFKFFYSAVLIQVEVGSNVITFKTDLKSERAKKVLLIIRKRASSFIGNASYILGEADGVYSLTITKM